MKKKVSNHSFGSASKIKNIIITRRVLLGAAFVLFGLSFAAIFWYQTSLAQRNEQNNIKTNEKQAENVWQTAEKSAIANRAEGLPDDFQTLRLDKQRLATLLLNAPHESRTPLRDSELLLQFPMPDGTFSRFRVQEAPVLEEGLQARFPEIKSYRAISLDTPGTTARFDLTPQGFHATILTPDKTFAILPADTGDETLYASYDGAAELTEHRNFICELDEQPRDKSSRKDSAVPTSQVSVGATLRTFRIAISTTDEYSEAVGGSNLTNTVASINTWLNATNAIYERDLAIRLIMVNDTDAIFTNNAMSPDEYSDVPNVNNIPTLLNQVRTELRNKVGVLNPQTGQYDVSTYNLGHLFARNQPGGVAGIGVICDNNDYGDGFGPTKGKGVTGLSGTPGNLGTLQVLVHELGHMFSAPHNFNSKYSGGQDFGCAGQTGGNREPTSAYESGAGNTIMAYPNRCGGIGDPQPVGDNVIGGEYLRFHSGNFAQINDHIVNGIGAACMTPVNAGNTAPTVSVAANYTIPRLTPFTLTATGSDSDQGDGNNLTYTWEQYQTGGANFFQDGTAASYNDALDPMNTTRPIFRAMPATISPSRTFPSLTYILNNANDPPDIVNNRWTAEELPRISRTIPFRVTVRDNTTGISDATTTVTVNGGAGPFTVNDPTGTWTGGNPQTVTWNVMNTNTAALAQNVRISLSTDGGQSFPLTLKASTSNDGSESVDVPNYINTSTARIKVEAVGNIFFDISGVNFSITPGGTCPIVTDISPKVAAIGDTVVITGNNFTNTGMTVAFNNLPAIFTYNSSTQITATVPTGATGGPITVSKSGCAAAESANFTRCDGTAVERGYGDNSENFSGGAARYKSYHVNRITPPSYPATLSEVRIYHLPENWNAGFPVGKAINIISAANPSGSTNINNLRFNERAATISARGSFVSYPVEPITITSGDFVVGYWFENNDSNPLPTNPPDDTHYKSPVAVDDQDYLDYSYISDNGITFQPQNVYRDIYMIRAVAYSGDCSSATCSARVSADDGTMETTGGGQPNTKNYYVNRLTPSSYPATLTGVRVQFASNYQSGAAVNILSAASPTGNADINNTTFNTKSATVTSPGSYANYAVDPITIYSGDFIVGYSSVNPSDAAFISLDLTPPLQNRSYFATGSGTAFFNDTGVNYPIRAVLFSNTCSVGNCTYALTTTIDGPFSAEGGEATLAITTEPGCPWRIARRNEWLSVNVGYGMGSATVVFTANQNASAVYRRGSFFVGPPTGTLSGNNLFENNLLKNSLLEDTVPEGEEIVIEQEAFAPTAASVPIGGRVTANGFGVPKARVSIINTTGEVRTVLTNPFGYYRFEEVSVGETYIVSVYSKRYNFAPQTINVFEEIENFDFSAQ